MPTVYLLRSIFHLTIHLTQSNLTFYTISWRPYFNLGGRDPGYCLPVFLSARSFKVPTTACTLTLGNTRPR